MKSSQAQNPFPFQRWELLGEEEESFEVSEYNHSTEPAPLVLAGISRASGSGPQH